MRDLIPRKELGTMTTRLFGDFWNEIDNFFSPTLHKFDVGRAHRFSYPRINIQDLEKECVVEAGIPGLTKDDVKVDYADGILTISAASQNESQEEKNGYVCRELHKSSFSRAITVDEETFEAEKITAEVENGILIVKIPKKVLDTAPPKRIIAIE